MKPPPGSLWPRSRMKTEKSSISAVIKGATVRKMTVFMGRLHEEARLDQPKTDWKCSSSRLGPILPPSFLCLSQESSHGASTPRMTHLLKGKGSPVPKDLGTLDSC